MQQVTEPQKPATPAPSSSDADAVNLLEYAAVVVKHRRLILRATLAALIISTIVSFVVPITYSSTTRIMPPQQSSGLMGMMMGQLGTGMASLAGDLLGGNSSGDLYVGILNSEAVKDVIIDQFKLMQVYDKPTRLDTYKALDDKVDVSVGKKDGIVSLTVEDEDPKRACEIANAYAAELTRITMRLDSATGGDNVTFLEERLARAKADLAKAEDAVKAFQSRNKAPDIDDQAKGTLQGVAALTAQLAVEEVKLKALRRSFTDSTQEVKNEQSVINALRAQIAHLEGSSTGSSIPSLGTVPELGQQFLRLMREFKIQEALVEILTKQYEMAKLKQANTVPSVQVLQKATVPDKKVKPKRSLIIALSTLATAFAVVLGVFIFEMFGRLPEEERRQWEQIRSMLQWRGTL